MQFFFVREEKQMTNATKCTVTGHSGCMGTAENSLQSIIASAENGADITEIDLRFAKDGTPILTHDAPKGNEVTLDAAFAKVSEYKSLLVNVDVKECTEQLSQISGLAEKHGIADRIFFTGLFEEDIPTAKKACPTVPCWLNMNVRPKILHTKIYLQRLVEKVKNTGTVGINMNKDNATKELVDLFHENGLQVSLWTVDDEDIMQKCIALSPDNITTRYPDKLLKFLK